MLELFLDECRVRVVFLRRRWWDQSLYLVTMAVTFCFFYVSGLDASGGSAVFKAGFAAYLVGYVLWITVFSVFQSVSGTLDYERAGALITILTSPYGVQKILLVRSIVTCLYQAVMIVPMCALMVLFTRIHIHLAPVMIVPLVSVLIAAVGFGYIMGAVQLVVKEMSYTANVCQFLLIMGIMGPIERLGKWALALSIIVPGAPGTAAIRFITRNQGLPPMALWLAIANALLYMGVGIYIFRKAEQKARRVGPVFEQ